ncbi:MAG TPA: tetratricopeptide repeat protein, partial [Bacteroidia bacterium]|nr:tetratricopeptide repeat protein [Bacteroidia bacterium]
YGDWGRYKQAVEKFDQGIAKLTKKIGKNGNYEQWELMAYLLWDKGFTISDKGDYDGALKAYNQALKILDSIGGSKSDRANVYRNVAYVSKKKGLYENALQKYRESLTLFNEAGNQQKYATLHDDIADTYFKMGQYRDAIAFYQKAYELKLILDDKSGAGFSKSNIGQAYWNLGNYDSAITVHSEAIVLRKEGNDIEGTAYSYEKIADLWKENGNFDSAIQYYQTAEAYYIKNNDTTDKLAELKGAVASLYSNMKNYQQAIYFYERKLQIFTAIGNELGVANAYYDIGVNYYYLSSFQQSEEYLLKAKAAYEKMKDKENIMYTLTWLSCVDRDGKSDFKSAEKNMKQALLLAKETESFSNQAYAWRVMGNLTLEQGKLEKAKKYYDSSLQFYTTLGNYEGAAYTKSAMAKYYIEKGQFQTARNLYWEGIDSGRLAKNFVLVSDLYVDLVHYYNLVGEFDSAKYIGYQAFDLNKEINNPYVEAGAFVNLGNTYNYLSKNKTAVAYYNKADSIYQAIKFSLGRTVPINNTGTIYFAQGDYTNALIQFDMAYQEHLKTGYKGEGYLSGMLNIGEVYYEDGLFTEAESWITKGLKESQKLGSQRKIAGAWLLLGKLRLKQGRYKEASGGLNNALKVYNTMGEISAVIEASAYLGKLYYETKKYDSAKIHIDKSIALSEQTGSTYILWLPLQTAAFIALEKKDTTAAVNNLIRSVETIENLKANIAGRSSNLVKFAKAQDKYKIYERLVEILVANNNIKLAFYYQEKANFAGLKELTRGGGDEGGTRTNELLGEAEEASAKELELKIDGYYAELIKEKSKPKDQQSPEKIKALQDLIDVNETSFVNFLDSAMTAQDGSEHQNFSNTINPADLDQDRFSLDDSEVVVEYLATENQLLIFVASNSSLNARKVSIKEADLNKAINEFYAQVSTSKS